MPEADQRPRVARVPAPRAALDDDAVPAPAPTEQPEADAPKARRRPAGRRRLPHPPGRRAPLWLAALIAGALLAAFPAVMGGSDPVRVDASDYGLGIGGEDPNGELADADARRGITEAEARARLGELAASRAAREPKVVSPVDSYRLTTCYCLRWGQMHYGLDMAAGLGTPIYAAVDGVVLEAGPASGFGNAVYIQDEDGDVHIYGHMRYYSVHAGQIVHAGDQIASVGNEGFSTGPHLHYEIHQGGRDGAPTDPQAWLESRGVRVG
jgi:murein DD-endopeptidase MepM/ murein hydrolase activator NlpD